MRRPVVRAAGSAGRAGSCGWWMRPPGGRGAAVRPGCGPRPRSGSAANRTMIAITASGTGGRPGGRGCRHRAATSRRCHRSSVPGVTIRCARSTFGSTWASAAKTARSGHDSRGFGLVRGRTATSCRSASISASFDADDRASRAIHENTWTTSRYGNRAATAEIIKDDETPGQTQWPRFRSGQGPARRARVDPPIDPGAETPRIRHSRCTPYVWRCSETNLQRPVTGGPSPWQNTRPPCGGSPSRVPTRGPACANGAVPRARRGHRAMTARFRSLCDRRDRLARRLQQCNRVLLELPRVLGSSQIGGKPSPHRTLLSVQDTPTRTGHPRPDISGETAHLVTLPKPCPHAHPREQPVGKLTGCHERSRPKVGFRLDDID